MPSPRASRPPRVESSAAPLRKRRRICVGGGADGPGEPDLRRALVDRDPHHQTSVEPPFQAKHACQFSSLSHGQDSRRLVFGQSNPLTPALPKGEGLEFGHLEPGRLPEHRRCRECEIWKQTAKESTKVATEVATKVATKDAQGNWKRPNSRPSPKGRGRTVGSASAKRVRSESPGARLRGHLTFG
jgi:hypothetical protein